MSKSSTEAEIGFVDRQTPPYNAIVRTETRDVSEYDSAKKKSSLEEIATIVDNLEGWLSHRSTDVRDMTFRERCQLAETLMEGDRERFWWECGKNGIAREGAKLIEHRYFAMKKGESK